MTIERLFLGHLIVATGYPSDDAMRTETFKWQNKDNSICHIPDYPIAINGAVTVLFEEDKYVCGGFGRLTGFTAKCFNLITGENAPFNLLHKRAGASSVSTNDKVFVFGGWNGSNDLASYETISVDHAQSEGVLPFTWKYGCSTLINSTTIFLAGGHQNDATTANTWFFNLKTEEWTKGPSMIEGRSSLGCGLIKSINGVAVFGGYPNTATTEVVKLPGGSFKKGNRQC